MTELDDELAQATDDVLSGRALPTLSDDNRELGSVVNELYRMIEPSRLPSAEAQQQMKRRLSSEWDRMYAPPQLRLLDRPMVRLAALAAAVVLVLAAVLVLAVPETPEQLQGAAIGLDDSVALMILVAVAAGGAAYYWRSRR